MNKETFPIWNFLPSMFQQGLPQIVFPIIVLSKDDHTDSFQDDWLDLPYWTMILAICVVVDETKCLDTPIWEFSIICEHLPFSLGYKLILRLLLVHRNFAIWRWYPWSWRLSFEMHEDPYFSKYLRKTLNRFLQYHLGVQPDLLFLVFCLQFCIFQITNPLMMQNEL